MALEFKPQKMLQVLQISETETACWKLTPFITTTTIKQCPSLLTTDPVSSHSKICFDASYLPQMLLLLFLVYGIKATRVTQQKTTHRVI